MQAAKDEVNKAKEELKDAEDALKDAKKIEDEDERNAAIAKAEEDKKAAEDQLNAAKDAESQARGNVMDAIKDYMGKGSKELLAFTAGVNRCMQAEAGMVRQQEAERTLTSAEAVLVFLAKMDGKQAPDINLRDYAGLSEEEALAKCEEMASQVVDMLDGRAADGTAEAGILTAIKQARTAVYLFQQIFGLGYDMLADDDALREGCEQWATAQSLTFSAHESTGFDAGGRGFDNDVFDAVQCGDDLILYPFIAIEKGQNGKIKYDTDASETVYFRPVDAPARAKEGNPQGTELYALDNKKTLWEAYQTIDNQEQVLGKVNVLPFEPKTIKLYIKPVDGARVPTKADVENYLALIYGSVFLHFDVEILPAVTGLDWDEDGDGKLASGEGEHGNLANYTSEQRTLIQAFEKVHNRGNKDLVVFWAPPASNEGALGYFPQGRAYGFLYAPDNSEVTFHTLAHELGHGAFNLKHIFDRFDGKVVRGDTDNLMDYGKPDEAAYLGVNRKSLYAYQWALTHEPLKVLGIENYDEDSELVAQLIQCFTAAAVDFALYYSINWVSMFFDDDITEVPDYTDFSAVTSYKEFSWKEATVSASISCGTAVVPILSTAKNTRKIRVLLGAFAGAAEGMATELAKQYDVAVAKLEGEGIAPTMQEVLRNLNWVPVLANAGISAACTATATFVATSPKFQALYRLMRQKLKKQTGDISKELYEYISKRLGKGLGDFEFPNWDLPYAVDWPNLKKLHDTQFDLRLQKLETYFDGTNGQTGALAMLQHVPTNKFDDLTKYLDNLSPEVRLKFLDDCADNVEFVKFLGDRPEAVDVWAIIKANHSKLAKDVDVLKSFNKLKSNPNFTKMGLSDDLISRINGAKGLGYKEILDNLDNLGRKASEKGIELVDFHKVASEMLEGGGKVDGANWITKYIGDNADGFAGKKLKFEEFTNTELGGRYVDVSDVTNDKFKIFYEFKSVSIVPPGHFQIQFMKDLTNSNSLDQIKWVFNPNKNPSGNGGKQFKEALLEEIEKLPITDELARKFLGPRANADNLLDLIESQFENIFLK
ncbi:hypothetical protein [Persicobacter diffluens]|uniref:Uncharacterized protein n=1 Tax=Persicobacter diffluens TaxID=981 RepID=A0AAN5AN71_9BACT|nr:hypothetical protein PEDI_36230 [Persicobacter diffluens]